MGPLILLVVVTFSLIILCLIVERPHSFRILSNACEREWLEHAKIIASKRNFHN